MPIWIIRMAAVSYGTDTVTIQCQKNKQNPLAAICRKGVPFG